MTKPAQVARDETLARLAVELKALNETSVYLTGQATMRSQPPLNLTEIQWIKLRRSLQREYSAKQKLLAYLIDQEL